MRRKHSHLLMVVLIMVIIMFVGYKILLPELSGYNIQEFEKDELGKYYAKQPKVDKNKVWKTSVSSDISPDKPRGGGMKISREDVVAELKTKYRLNWNYKLLESPWTVAANWFSSEAVFPEEVPELGAVLREMATRKIIAANNGKSGTQLKMTLTLEGGQTVAFKPKWYPRDKIIEGVIYSGADRHNGEIAAFHLSRVMEIRRTFLTVGRVVDMETEIRPVADKALLDTYFYKNTSTCFYGKCYFCKGEETGVCADGTKLEGSLILWLPRKALPLTKIRHPWARVYNPPTGLAKWQKDKDYCYNTVLLKPQFSAGRLLLDVVDTAVLDFLISNGDRHQLETSSQHYANPFMFALDNGKSFGNPHHDEKSILGPLFQCCRIRESTWLRLLMYEDGILSDVLQDVLSVDPIAPIITDLHLQALDRRLKIILNTIKLCIAKLNVEMVLIKDG